MENREQVRETEKETRNVERILACRSNHAQATVGLPEFEFDPHHQLGVIVTFDALSETPSPMTIIWSRSHCCSGEFRSEKIRVILSQSVRWTESE